MKSIFALVFALSFSFSFFSQTLTFKVDGLKVDTVHLVKYVGKALYYADTAVMVNGTVKFDASKQEPGILALLLPSQKYFEIVYNNEDVAVQTKGPDFVGNMKVIKSKENEIFMPYLKFIGSKRRKAEALSKQRDGLPADKKDERAALDEKIKSISEEVKAYQKNISVKHADMLVGKIVNMSRDLEIPEAPKGEDGKPLDTLFNYHYYRDHYFDNIDMTDSKLVNTPLLENKWATYYTKTLIQNPDTLIKYIFRAIDKAPEGTMMYRFLVTKATAHFERSKIMGMDKVKNYLINYYYCSTGADGKAKAFWYDEDKLEDICKTAATNITISLGTVPPNIILRDTTDVNWRGFYDLESDYTILYFWDPECGHCKKDTPKLEKLYTEKLKARNVEIFAVGKATGDDFEKWKAFIRENKLSFINVGLTNSLYEAASKDPRQFIPKYTTIESLNYQDTYDIFSTPRVFILDKDKKIIGYKLSISQLEEMLDRLQGKEDAEKLFPREEELKELKEAEEETPEH